MFSKKLAVLEQERRALKAELERQQVGFQQERQRKEQRREFDLSDPKGLQKSLPARLGDDDPRCGPASIQKCGVREDWNTLVAVTYLLVAFHSERHLSS